MINTINTILMSNGGQSNSTSTMIMFGLMFLIFYFFMIRPQIKKQKELQKFRSEMKEGDSVVTSGGIHGKLSKIEEHTVNLKIEDGSIMKIEKSAILKNFSQSTK